MSSKIIVGLGNPGDLYKNTRHNVGFRVVKEIASRNALTLRRKVFYDGRSAHGSLKGKGFYLWQPGLYMNQSGESVVRILRKYGIGHTQLLVIVDDVALPFGVLRLRDRGSAGGHNGLKSIEHHLRTNEYARLRVGIGLNSEIKLDQYVLGCFTSDEEKALPEIIEKAAQTAENWLTQD